MGDIDVGMEVIPYFFLLIFLMVFGFTWLESHRKPRRDRKMDAQWYADRYPSAVVDNTLTCRVCGGKEIGTRSGMKPSHPKQHFCKQCDTVLYYSTDK